MWAIGFEKYLDIDEPNSLMEFQKDIPKAKGRDLLVKVAAVSVNPVDIVARKQASEVDGMPQVIGFDAVGVVKEVGNDVEWFKPGDRVFYAGSFKRSGSNQEYQLVDERIVGHAPIKLSDLEAAAMPLTSLTAIEVLKEKFGIDLSKKHPGQSILIINGAGGVGSIATQLSHMAGLTVIATASREETKQWCLKHGADYTVNHHQDIVTEVHKLGFENVDYILDLHSVDNNWDTMVELIKPLGHIASIAVNQEPLKLVDLKRKAASFSWEWMFAKSYFETADMATQHEYLEYVSRLLDKGLIKSTVTTTLSPINVDSLKEAHRKIESGQTIGKIVIVNK